MNETESVTKDPICVRIVDEATALHAVLMSASTVLVAINARLLRLKTKPGG